MRLMLCPPSLCLHGSSIPLFDGGQVRDQFTSFFLRSFFMVTTLVFAVVFMDSCNLCHSNKLESLFECPVSCSLYDEGEVEVWMYEPIDLTVQSATNSAKGAPMQGERLFLFCLYL